jgi:hypothetical protein
MRRIALASATLSAVVLMAVAIPASARVPGGQGFESFGFADCGELGEAEIVGPPSDPAATGYLVFQGGSGLHVVATQFELTFDGEVVFSKSFGKKAGLTTITCTQTFEEPDGTGVFTLTAAIVPPQ